jgi:hypothetical protein
MLINWSVTRRGGYFPIGSGDDLGDGKELWEKKAVVSISAQAFPLSWTFRLKESDQSASSFPDSVNGGAYQ